MEKVWFHILTDDFWIGCWIPGSGLWHCDFLGNLWRFTVDDNV